MSFCVLLTVLVVMVSISSGVFGLVASGVSFYRVRGDRCLTTVPALQSFANGNVTSVSSCMLKCYANAQCAAFQFVAEQAKCDIYRSITHDTYWSNSEVAAPDYCIVYNRQCPKADLYFNFTSIIWYRTNAFVTGTYWYSSRINCFNLRYELLVINSMAMLTYMNANSLASNGHWFVGGSTNLTTNSTTWVDGTSPVMPVASGYPFCTAAVDNGCLFYYNPYGAVMRGNCDCSCHPMCGCYEWGRI